MKRPNAILIGLAACFAAGIGAQVRQPLADGYTVEVTFSEALERRMASINRMEQRFEERFRTRRHDQPAGSMVGSQRFAAIRTAGTEWAGERLIAEVADFTVENLVEAMVVYNVNRAVPGFGGRIDIRIDELQLSNPSMSWLRSNRSYAKGYARVTTADGRVVFDGAIRSDLVVRSTVDTSYSGPDLAFGETEPSRRVGPTLAQFVERVLERAWPEQRTEMAGPVVVRLTGPHERVNFNR